MEEGSGGPPAQAEKKEKARSIQSYFLDFDTPSFAGHSFGHFQRTDPGGLRVPHEILGVSESSVSPEGNPGGRFREIRRMWVTILNNILVLIKGAGDLATGVAVSLHKCGMKVIMIEIAQPRAIRGTVALAEAIYEGQMEVEEVRAIRAARFQDAEEIIGKGHIPIFVDEKGEAIAHFRPEVVVDATMAKRNLGTHLEDARIVIALGPGFTAGEDVHAVVETMRGHYLGRVIFDGRAMENTGIPADIQGYGLERVLRAPTRGKVRTLRNIGDFVQKGEIVAYVDGQPVRAGISGVIRGMIKSGIEVEEDLKIGDVDPRGVREYCYTISDKSRAIGRAALEAILILLRTTP